MKSGLSLVTQYSVHIGSGCDVLMSVKIPLDRLKGPTPTSGATTVTLSTAMALRFKDKLQIN